MTFGEFLATTRKEKGLTQKELAKKLYVSESTVSKWEQNKSNPDITMLPILSEILEVSEHELISASKDTMQRENNKNAKRWKNLVTSWNLAFIIAYSIALLTCFIVNLAINKTLSWFWIVLTSLALSASLTNLPSYVKKYRLLILTLSPLLFLLLLLLVCCLYSNGNWFLISAGPITFSFIIIFMPIYITYYRFPIIIKQHSSVFCVILDALLLLAMLFYIQTYTQSQTNWAIHFATPLVFISLAIALTVVLCARYLPISKLFKSSIIVLISAIAYPILMISTYLLAPKEFGVLKPTTFSPNFSIWQGNYLNDNINLIIVITLVLISLTLFTIGLIQNLYKK